MPLAEAALRDQAGELAADRFDGLLGALRIDVGQDDRRLEAAQEQGRQLCGHEPRADEADALDPSRLRVRDRGRALDPALDDVVGVDRRLRLVPRQQLGERLLLRCVPLLHRPSCGALDQLECPVRGRCLAVDDVVDTRAGLANDLGDVGEVGGLALLGPGFDPANEKLERLVDELDRLEHDVDEPVLERVGGPDQPVLLERVVDDQLHCRLGADQSGRQLRPTPGGKEPEGDLGEPDMSDVRSHGAGVTVERELEAPSERGAVDRGEGRVGQVAQSPEELVPGTGALAGALRRDPGELRDVGAHGEDERLARDEHPAPVARLELLERLAERAQRVLTEGVGLPPVGAVVDRDERNGPDARVESLEVKSRDRVRHDARSPRGARRPFPSRCRGR